MRRLRSVIDFGDVHQSSDNEHIIIVNAKRSNGNSILKPYGFKQSTVVDNDTFINRVCTSMNRRGCISK